MRVRGLIMRADGDKGSREMEAELRPDCFPRQNTRGERGCKNKTDPHTHINGGKNPTFN